MKKFITLFTTLFLFACQTTDKINSSITEKQPINTKPNISIPIVGGVETLYIPPFEVSFQARMDTGAETSSIDAYNIRPFERDGEKWISFDIINRKNSQIHHFKKPIIRKTSIVRTGNEEKRYVVNFDIKMGDEIIDAEFTLNDRSKFEYQVLIGRNIINGRYLIDASIENTLH